jgi:phosphohistidine phosphatase
MKLLMLLRHAKSSWKNPLLEDRERVLTKRGRVAAQTMGHEMARLKLQPDCVLCSTARRAAETFAHVVPALGPHYAMHYEDGLYEADAQGLLERIRTVSDAVSALLIVGHNPAMEELACQLSKNLNSPAGRHLAEKYPTAALAVFEIDSGWAGLRPGEARLRDFLTPRALGGSL